MMRALLGVLPYIVFVVAAMSSAGLYAQTNDTPSSIDKLIAKAQEHWKMEAYAEYAETCRQIETLQPGFSPAFNAALGLYRVGFVDESLAKIADIAKKYTLSERQKKSLDGLRNEVESRKYFVKQALSKERGKITLSTNPGIPTTMNCPHTRSANCLGLRPEEAEAFMKRIAEELLIQNGYAVPPRNVNSQPDSFEW